MADLDWLSATPIARRGLHDGNKTLWENTLPAFELAALYGYSIHLAVQRSRDGVPMVFHDKTLERLCGIKKRIIDLRHDELANLRLAGSQQKILSLSDVLKDIDGKVPFIVEIIGNVDEDTGLITATADLLSLYQNYSAMVSRDIHILRRFRISGQAIPYGIAAKGVNRDDIERHFSMLAHYMKFVIYKHSDMPNPFIRFVRNHLQLPVLAATIHHQEEWEKVRPFANQMIFENFKP